MYGHHHKPLLSRRAFFRRQLRWAAASGGLMLCSLLIGALGYHWTADLAWLDAFHAAAMILTGMGPVAQVSTTGAKLFETCYALFAGVIYLTMAAMLLAPIAHRVLHRFHLEDPEPKG